MCKESKEEARFPAFIYLFLVYKINHFKGLNYERDKFFRKGKSGTDCPDDSADQGQHEGGNGNVLLYYGYPAILIALVVYLLVLKTGNSLWGNRLVPDVCARHIA